MPRKKNQTKRGKNRAKSRKTLLSNFLSFLNINIHSNSKPITTTTKYINSNSLTFVGILCLFMLSLCTYCTPCIAFNQYLLRINPITYLFRSSFMNVPAHNHNINVFAEEDPHTHKMDKNKGQSNQFCRIQTPSPNFQRQLETENKGYIAFEGCRVVPSADNTGGNMQQNVQIMSDEEKDINEIMAQLHSNAATNINSFADSILNTHINSNIKPKKHKKAPKKDKRKSKGKKKKKSKPKKTQTVIVDEDTDKLREMDESNEFGIDVQRHKDTDTVGSEETVTVQQTQGSNAWQPRRDRDTVTPPTESAMSIDKEVMNETTNDIDVNLMGMYRRGLESQLNKMHYASDTAYEQIMEDISANGIAQSDIYGKYHIDFIPDETSFKLIPPPNIYSKDAFVSNRLVHRVRDSEKNKALKNFYTLTRMQQKYIKNEDSSPESVKNSDESDLDCQSMSEDMTDMRHILGHTPRDVLNVVLNDAKLPQWLYESDTIMDINCGIGDNLVHLLKNFTTINGICVVGTSEIKYKYARMNIANHGLLDRVRIVNRDLYDPYVRQLYNVSDVIFMDFSVYGDDEYMQYFITDIMNDKHIRQAKPGRVILSYDKLLFDSSVFQASYTLRFAYGWKGLRHDVSMYMYSIPFFLSKLSNLYVQNYQIFYGYHMHPIFEGLDIKFGNENVTKLGKDIKSVNARINSGNSGNSGSGQQQCINTKVPKNDAIFKKILNGNNLNKADSVGSIGSMGNTDVFEVMTPEGGTTKVWSVLPSQVLYQSFVNVLGVNMHSLTEFGIDKIVILDMDKKTQNKNYDWQYLEDIFNKYKINACNVYQSVLEQWRREMSVLFREFNSLFFYDSVKESAELRMKAVLDKCQK